MVIKMSWKDILKDTATATRSADLWSMNDYGFYKNILNDIKFLVKKGHTKKEILGVLASEILPEKMAHLDGFMEELTEMGPSDGLSDVDWEEVARNFDEDIDSIMEDYKVVGD